MVVQLCFGAEVGLFLRSVGFAPGGGCVVVTVVCVVDVGRDGRFAPQRKQLIGWPWFGCLGTVFPANGYPRVLLKMV